MNMIICQSKGEDLKESPTCLFCILPQNKLVLYFKCKLLTIKFITCRPLVNFLIGAKKEMFLKSSKLESD